MGYVGIWFARQVLTAEVVIPYGRDAVQAQKGEWIMTDTSTGQVSVISNVIYQEHYGEDK